MTTSPSPAISAEAVPPAPPRVETPAAPLTGVLSPSVAAARYAFSDSSAGTMSPTVGDGDHTRHRAALAAAVGVAPDRIAWMDQVHGDVVVTATAPADPPPACDGVVTTEPGLGLGVLAADCVPVLLASPGGVAAAHAGRAGVVNGVVVATARRLLEVTGDDVTDLDVVLGPAIGPCCYEVSEDVADEVVAAIGGAVGRRVRTTTTWGTTSVDLPGAVVAQLDVLGVHRIRRAGACTRCGGRDRWFSHRATLAEGRPAGRHAGVVVHLAGGRRA